MNSSGALVRIHVVAELTGVPEPTLRAWERRYGIPSPERTTAGYRLYGPREIEQVRRMRALCDAGVNAAEAVRRVKSVVPSTKKGTEDPASAARRAILDSVAKFDVAGLERHLLQALFFGNPLEIVEHIIEPVLVEIGARWERGELTVAQEHFASHRLGTLLQDFVRLASVPSDSPRILLGCFADDDHELGLRALAIRLAHWGWKPINLGARLPPDSVRGAVESAEAVAIGLSLTIMTDLVRGRDLIAEYGVACGDTPWVVGGSGVASLEKVVRAAGGLVAPAELPKVRALFDGLRRKVR